MTHTLLHIAAIIFTAFIAVFFVGALMVCTLWLIAHRRIRRMYDHVRSDIRKGGR